MNEYDITDDGVLVPRSDWLTVKEYAYLMRVHVQTVYAAIRANRLNHPVARIGNTIRIDVSRESITGRIAS